MAKAQPRGIRNNNPGNLRPGAPWQGLATPPVDVLGGTPGYLIFKTPSDGIRAIARTLITYQDKRKAKDGSKIDTIRELIERWAPAADSNDEEAYARHVGKLLSADPDDPVDVHQYATCRALVVGIITHENGVQPYPDDVIDKGLLMAGIQPPVKPLKREPKVIATQVAGGAITLGMVQQGAEALAPYSSTLQSIAHSIPPWALGVVALVAVGFIGWYFLRDRQRGVA